MRVTILVGLVVLFAIDRITKHMIKKAPEILGPFFDFVGVTVEAYTNAGTVFGGDIGQHTNLIILVVSVVLLLMVMYVLVQAWRQGALGTAFLWGLIFIGGVSNVFDRITERAVLDWVVMPWGVVINLADIYITVAAVLLIARLYLDKKKV